MKLKDWAKSQGISYLTAYRWFRAGTLPIPNYQNPSGTIIVQSQEIISPQFQKSTFIYCRVSSYEKKDDLDRQVQRCLDFAAAKGLSISKVVKEIASGMNDKRPKLLELLNHPPNILVVEHKDRLTRFGFNYIETLLSKLNCELIVINRDSEEKDDLMKDLISIITSFCCRLYGLRRGRKKVKELKCAVLVN